MNLESHWSELSRPHLRRVDHAAVAELATMTVNDRLVVGYSKVPVSSASHNTGELFALVLLVNQDHHVVAVDCTAVTSLLREWLSARLVGVDITQDPGEVVAWVEQHYLGTAGGSIKQAIQDAWKRYASQQMKEQRI